MLNHPIFIVSGIVIVLSVAMGYVLKASLFRMNIIYCIAMALAIILLVIATLVRFDLPVLSWAKTWLR